MTLVGIFGILFGLSAVLLAFVRADGFRLTVFIVAYLMHVGMALLYHQLVSAGGGDAWLYYANPLGLTVEDLKPGTQFVVYITQLLRSAIGGTYLDFFLVFQAIGFFGIVCLMRIFEEIYDDVGIEQPNYIYALLLIPGFHYWSSAVGKDSLFFFATCLTLWASLRHMERLPALIFGMLLMLAIRPHVAVISMAALAVTVVADRNSSVPVRVALFGAALIGTAFSIATVWSTFQIDLTRTDTISDHLAGREALVQTEGAGRTSVDAIYPVRVLSLLFRPFFFDANGALGLVVSLENAFLVPIIGTLIFRRKVVWKLLKTVPFSRYALVSSVGILLQLSLGYYNVGLGIRQKSTMILPGLIVFFVAVQAVRKARREAAAVPSPAGSATAYA